MENEERNEGNSSINGSTEDLPVKLAAEAKLEWNLNLQACIINLLQTVLEAHLSGRYPTHFLEPLMAAITVIVDNMIGADEDIRVRVMDPDWSNLAGPTASDFVQLLSGNLDLWTITEAAALRDLKDRSPDDPNQDRHATIVEGLEAFTFLNAPKVREALANVIIDDPQVLETVISRMDLVEKASQTLEHFSIALSGEEDTSLLTTFYSFVIWLREYGVPAAMSSSINEEMQRLMGNDADMPSDFAEFLGQMFSELGNAEEEE